MGTKEDIEDLKDLLDSESGEPESNEPLATPVELDDVKISKPKKEPKINTPQTGREMAQHSPTKPELPEGAVLPKAKIIENGKVKRRERAVALGLSELVIPPLVKSGIAVYQWLGEDRIDPTTKQKPDPKDIFMPGSYMFYDPGEGDPTKSNKLMRNLGRPNITRDEHGKEKIEDTVDEIEFVAGMKRVNIQKEFKTYVFLELHPLNSSNRFRDKTIAPKFKRIDIHNNKTDAFRNALEDLAMDAEMAVRNMIKKDMLIGYATSANIPTSGLDVSTIKSSLRKWARENPRKFFALANNVLPAIKLNVLDALGLGLIEYAPDKKTFYFAETEERIFTHLAEEDPTEAFVKALSREYQDAYRKIQDLLNYWE